MDTDVQNKAKNMLSQLEQIQKLVNDLIAEVGVIAGGDSPTPEEIEDDMILSQG